MGLGTSAEGRSISLTPDNRVIWRHHDLGDGDLFLPPGATLQQASLVLTPARGREFGQGNSGGRIYEATLGGNDAVAVKEFSEIIDYTFDHKQGLMTQRFLGERGGLPTLRADVMLTTGLARINQDRAAWRFRGAEVLGAFVLKFDSTQAPVHNTLCARWLVRRAFPVENIDPHDYMQFREKVVRERIDGSYQTSYSTVNARAKLPLPGIKQRRQLYTDAFLSSGADARMLKAIDIDDHPDNVIIEKMPAIKGMFLPKVQEQGLVTKIDVSATEALNF